MIEYINGRPAATQEDLAGILAYETLYKLVQRGNAERARRGCHERPALYYVDTLPAKYKPAVYHRFPDLQGQKEAVTVLDLLEVDHLANKFFSDYETPDGRKLKDPKVEELTNNCSILNAFKLRLQRSDEESIRHAKPKIRRGEFWRKAAEILPRLADEYPHSLPGNPARLQEKFNQYMNDGYKVFISGKIGNKNKAKIETEYQESLLLSLCKAGNNLDSAQIAARYNEVARSKGWPEISRSTADGYKRKHSLYTYAGNHGKQAFYDNKAMQVKRARPDEAMVFWVHDGWTAEFYYQADGGFTNRMTLEVVLDPCCNYPIGFAISRQENVALITDALADALRHSKELFGERYIPYELQSDNYAKKATRPVYLASCIHYIPAKVKNAKSKVVEPYFHYLIKNYAQYMKNWSGFGVTSRKEVQPSVDWLNANKHLFPTEEECIRQITGVVMMERAKKRDQYLKCWGNTDALHKNTMTDETFLRVYGKETGHKNVLEGKGLRVRIGGERIQYDSFDIRFRTLSHLRWIVKYDEKDLSHVLAISENGEYRFMLEQKYVQPMALADRKPGDAEQLQRVFRFNRDLEAHVAAVVSNADRITEQIFAHNSELDNTLAKHVITDSRGQHKDLVSRKRLAEAKAGAQEVKVEPAGEDFDFEAAQVERVLVPRRDPEQDEEFNRFNIY